MTHARTKKICSSLICACVLFASLRTPVFAATDEDLQTLGMFYEGTDLVVSATRNPKPISQTAENVTVVTAADIEMMGAHTLVDVLANIPGIQAADRGGPGAFADFTIQGADVFNILFLLDGVTLNFAGDQFVDIGAIPVQNIERLEIIKGPASSSWGSALGGVVNIITKSPIEDKKLGGALSFSAGERETRDTRGEAAGTLGQFGYYLYAGNLTSNGFRPNTAVDQNNLYGKLRWELPNRGSLQGTIAYDRGNVGDGDTGALGFFSRLHKQYILSTASFTYPVNDKIDIDLSLRLSQKRTDDSAMDLSGAPLPPDFTANEFDTGGSAKLVWREGKNNLAAGADFDHLRLDDTGFSGSVKLYSDKYGLFLIDTLSFGDVAVTPGIRYDRMRQVGDFYSPSLGVAWALNDTTILRIYGARGYSLPVLADDATQQKVLTAQAGLETARIPYLWLKTTLFWNRLTDVHSFDSNGNATLVKQRKQGVEVEGRTVPLFNTSLSAGYTFVDASDLSTGETLLNVPSQIVKLGVHYDDKSSLRGALLGRYVWYNASFDNNARDKAFIWDLNLAKKVVEVRGTAFELFFSAHNLFNGAQYSADFNKNVRRWVEGGIRCNF
ncbi:MAG TPA: TonB-dependent receptor [Geobacteraceae bacterium]|nr:TonB-dependent receptor [Geobacteraceae bacterium]